jgi:hypothetical protein
MNPFCTKQTKEVILFIDLAGEKKTAIEKKNIGILIHSALFCVLLIREKKKTIGTSEKKKRHQIVVDIHNFFFYTIRRQLLTWVYLVLCM